MSAKRPYKLRKRAESKEQTRQRIIEAAMHLHEEIGPRATTISALANKAGVQRLTVYRHFPDESAVFRACTSHWLSLNPPPGPAEWNSIEDPVERCRAALSAFYGYYRRTERMWAVSYRDEADVAALQGPMNEFRDLVTAIAAELASAFGEAGRNGEKLRATLSHALAFPAWASLKSTGLSEAEMVELVSDWISCMLR